jgi:hypothetical protein
VERGVTALQAETHCIEPILGLAEVLGGALEFHPKRTQKPTYKGR